LTADGSLVNDEAVFDFTLPSKSGPRPGVHGGSPKQASRDHADDQDHLVDPVHRRRAGQVSATVVTIVKVLAAAQIDMPRDASAVDDANDSSFLAGSPMVWRTYTLRGRAE
jgi:hypothetical protein